MASFETEAARKFLINSALKRIEKCLTCPGTLGTLATSSLVVGNPGMMLIRAPALPEYIPEPET